MIEFKILGDAQPAGSKRAFIVKTKDGGQRAVVTDANKNSKSWQHAVRTAAAEAYQGPLLEGPIRLTVEFYRVRPKKHFYSTKANFGQLRHDAPQYPTSKPDCTKLLRGLEDALTQQVWRDDAQIVQQLVAKCWGERPCAIVRIEALSEANQQQKTA